MEFQHVSVLLEETIEGLNIRPDGICDRNNPTISGEKSVQSIFLTSIPENWPALLLPETGKQDDPSVPEETGQTLQQKHHTAYKTEHLKFPCLQRFSAAVQPDRPPDTIQKRNTGKSATKVHIRSYTIHTLSAEFSDLILHL